MVRSSPFGGWPCMVKWGGTGRPTRRERKPLGCLCVLERERERAPLPGSLHPILPVASIPVPRMPSPVCSPSQPAPLAHLEFTHEGCRWGGNPSIGAPVLQITRLDTFWTALYLREGGKPPRPQVASPGPRPLLQKPRGSGCAGAMAPNRAFV